MVRHVAGSQPPPTAAPSVDQRLPRVAEAIVMGMKGATAAKTKRKERFASHEKVKILAAGGPHKGEFDQVPPICDKITEGGRTHLAAIRDTTKLERRATSVASELLSSASPVFCIAVDSACCQCKAPQV